MLKYVLDTCALDIKLEGEVYITPEVAAEINKESHSYIVRAPAVSSLQISVHWLGKFIEDFETRIKKGLKYAEEAIRSDQNSDELIRKVRKQWKDGLKNGIVDSMADFSSLLLAKELDAILVTLDEGMKKTAREMGIKIYER